MNTRKKTGGRIKGTPNKINAETKDLILKVLLNEHEQLDTVLLCATPKQRLDFFIKLLPFVCSKQPKNIEVNGDLTDFEITVNGKHASLFALFSQEDRINRLEQMFDRLRK